MFFTNLLQFFSIFSTFVFNNNAAKVTLPDGGVLVGNQNTTTFYGRNIVSYLGIPYALPPVNDLRLRDPVPYGSWKGEIKAQNFKDHCPQYDYFNTAAGITGSEDCLYLNVYVPEKPKTKGPLPVIFYIYGGSNVYGSSDTYEPDYLLDHDVIIVAPNFRVGTLAFLSSETLDCPGNFAYKDQVEALKWTQKNIAAFGGDPNKVTIFGESSGASSVSYHMLSEKSKGLFQKAIIHAGSYITNWAYPLPKGVAANRTREIANSLGCDGFNTDWTVIMDCLRSKPVAEITPKYSIFRKWRSFPIIPLTTVIEPKYDGAFLTEDPLKIKNPHGNSLPLLTGYNKDEGTYLSPSVIFLEDALKELKQNFNEYLPYLLKTDLKSQSKQLEVTQKVNEFYFKDGPTFSPTDFQNFTDLISDSDTINGVDELIRQRITASNSASTFAFYFQHQFENTLTDFLYGLKNIGISHFDEMQAFFPLRSYFPNITMSEENVKIRNQMIELWINFVSKGVPSSSDKSIPEWTPASEYPPLYMNIGKTKNVADQSIFAMEKLSIQPRLDLWHDLNAVVW